MYLFMFIHASLCIDMHPGICLLHTAREQENKMLYVLGHLKKWKNNSVQ